MPKEIFNRDYQFLERELLLSFEEIERLTRIFASLGVVKVRLTGGEPLLRKGIEDLIGSLAGVEHINDLTLTTNGSLLARKADALASAGLNRVTVSLDSLDEKVFQDMNDVGFAVTDVLAGIEAAAGAGLTPVKVNVVIKRGVNDRSILPMAEHFRDSGHVVRFIEFMDVGATNGWQVDDVVRAANIIAAISAKYPLQAVEPEYPGEVARRWRYADGAGEIGVISSVSGPFCGTCTRARLSAEGRLYTCLFATRGTDLRGPLRSGASDADLETIVRGVWAHRDDRYSEIRSAATVAFPKVEMSYIGG
jgi:cyclic pyranopterin phosphate synthase